MKSVMRTTGRVVTQDERKRIVTLRPKGTKSDYNGCRDVIGNGQTVSGSQVASKVFTIICDVELGKPHKLPEYPGRDSVRANDGLGGRGIGKNGRRLAEKHSWKTIAERTDAEYQRALSYPQGG